MVVDRLARRLDKIEKEVGKDKDKPVWLCLPDHNNPGETIEFVGCRTIVDLVRMAAKARKEEQYDQEHRETT